MQLFIFIVRILPSISFNKRSAWALLLYADDHSGDISIACVNKSTEFFKSPFSAALTPLKYFF